MAEIADQINAVKGTLTGPLPTPPSLTDQVSPDHLKTRLNWGEPALTIVDVRDRPAYNQARITGAVTMPLATLPDAALAALERDRDIFLYGGSDEETAAGAHYLREAGFVRVAELQGGLALWQQAGGAIEGATV